MRMLSTTTLPASAQVAFSRKSVVLRTPMIWFDEENPEANPPPFEFCTSTIRIRKIDARKIKMDKNTYMRFYCFEMNNR